MVEWYSFQGHFKCQAENRCGKKNDPISPVGFKYINDQVTYKQ